MPRVFFWNQLGRAIYRRKPPPRDGPARVVREIAAMPVLDTRSVQDIMDDLNGA